MASDQYVAVSEEEMTLEHYPCGVDAGSCMVPKVDLYGTDEAGRSVLYLKKGRRCLVLTGDPREPEVIWFRICATGEIATWDDTFPDSFEPAPPKPDIHPDILPGKNLLVEIVRCDSRGREIGRDNHFGEVVKCAAGSVTIRESGRPECFTVPFMPEAFEECGRELVFTFGDVSVAGVDFVCRLRTLASNQDQEH